jgi:hypothetical protein
MSVKNALRYTSFLVVATIWAAPASAQGRSHGRSLRGIDMCGLVTSEAVISGLAARRTGPHRDASTAATRACQYQYSIGEANYASEIAVVPLAEFEAVRDRHQGNTMRSFRGLGDASFALQEADSIVLYAVKLYDVAVRVKVRGDLNDTDDLLHARALARRALDALRR